MPLREEFFDTPMIRATPAQDLNDPFEGHFNIQQVTDADRNHRSFFKKNVSNYDDSIEQSMIHDNADFIRSEFDELGILSFTEDYNNPLMWSHYADQHRGIVIEFDFSIPFFVGSIKEVNGKKCRFGESYLADFYESPEKVNYRRDMPNFERPELSAPDSIEQYHWEKFKKAILFTKANDWIYEKEQRIVVRLIDADVIICNYSTFIEEVCVKDPSIKIEMLENGRMKIIYPDEYEMHEYMGDESLKHEIFFRSKEPGLEPIYLFKINPEAISGVYFGCKADYKKSLCKINKNLEHIENVLQMSKNPTRYEFDPVPI